MGRGEGAQGAAGVYLTLDQWDAQELYERARALPYKSTREHALRERVEAKLSWARPVRDPEPLYVVFGDDAQ
jgi:hypothetical protein